MRHPASIAVLLSALGLVLSCAEEEAERSVSPPPPVLPVADDAPAIAAIARMDIVRLLDAAERAAVASGSPAAIAIVDRVGNVLAVMDVAAPGGGQRPETVQRHHAIARALTAAYLSTSAVARRSEALTALRGSDGEAPGTTRAFLACSDIATRADPRGGPAALLGPKRSPLGLVGEPGGVPLYKAGAFVGAIGVAVAAPDEPAASIAIAEAGVAALSEKAGPAPALRMAPDMAPGSGMLVNVPGYAMGRAALEVRDGVGFGADGSGFGRDEERFGESFLVLTDAAGLNRFPPRAGRSVGSPARPLTAGEAKALLLGAGDLLLKIYGQTGPADGREAAIALADPVGEVLGVVLTPDAPVAAIDLSVQQARLAAFLGGGGDPMALLPASEQARTLPADTPRGDCAFSAGRRLGFSGPLANGVGSAPESVPIIRDGEVIAGLGLARPDVRTAFIAAIRLDPSEIVWELTEAAPAPRVTRAEIEGRSMRYQR